MCLAKVDSEVKTKRKRGYKVVMFCDGTGICPEYGYNHCSRYKVGVWMEDPADFTIHGYHINYRTGFHIFLSLKGATSWMSSGLEIRKVKFGDVVATGVQELSGKSYRCVVARKICIGDVVNI